MKKFLIALLLFFALFEVGSLVNDALAHGPVKTLYFRRCNYNPGVRWQVRYQVIFADQSKSGYIYGTTGPESAHGDYYAEEVCNSFSNRTGASEPLVNTGSNAADPPHPGGFISSRLGPRQEDTKIVWSTACVDPVIDAITIYETPNGHSIWEFVEDVSFRRNVNGCNVPNSGCTGFNSGNLISEVQGKGTINFSETGKCSNNPPPPRNVIRGFVFIDRNNDGDYDGTDACYKNRFNILRNGDSDNYSATGCGNGNDPYFVWTTTRTNNTICLDVPNGYRMTNNRCRDTNGDATLRFGIAPDRGEISGIVYIDENTNGNLDGKDTRRRDDLVRMDPNGANETSRTNSDGRYRFGDLNPGSDHNIRLDGINVCRLTIQGDNPKTNINAPAGGNNNVNFRLTRRYFNIFGNIYRYVPGVCTPTINTGCQAYGRSVKVTVLGEGRNDDSRPGDAPDYTVTRIQDQGGAYTVRLSGLRTGESVVGGNDKDVNIDCANERQDWFIQPAGATEFSISGSVYVNTNGTAGLQTGGATPDERYTGGGTIQIRTGNNSASTGRTGPLSDSGTYIVDENPQNTNYRVRLQTGTLATGYTINGSIGNDLVVNMATQDVSRVNFLLNPPAGSTYSIQGGVYVDSDNPEARKTDSEPYVARSGSESITITNRGDGSTRTITNFTQTANGFSSTGLPAGQYWVDFSGPNGRGAGWRVTYPSGTSPFRIALTLGPSCNDDATDQDGVALCTAAGNVTDVDFGVKEQNDDPWYQSVGGDVRVDEDNYRNIIPAGTSPVCGNTTYPYVSSSSIANNLTSGILFTGNTPDLSNTGNDRAKASNQGWLVSGNNFTPAKPGTIRTSYTYMSNVIEKGRLTVNQMFGTTSTKACTTNSGPDCELKANLLNGIYKSTNSVTIRGSGNPETYTFPNGRDYVFLIEDDLRIESNIQVNPGSTVTFIVGGDIRISPDVTEIDGIYSTDGSFITLGTATGNDNPLRIEGNVVANAGLNSGKRFDQRRDLGDLQNVDCPAVTFVTRPDFILNGPELIRYTNYVIQEIAPGADRSSQGAAGFIAADTYTPPFTQVPDAPPACVKESDPQFCARKIPSAKRCGRFVGLDNCGDPRIVENCGDCSVSGETCGGAGPVNICGREDAPEAAQCPSGNYGSCLWNEFRILLKGNTPYLDNEARDIFNILSEVGVSWKWKRLLRESGPTDINFVNDGELGGCPSRVTSNGNGTSDLELKNYGLRCNREERKSRLTHESGHIIRNGNLRLYQNFMDQAYYPKDSRCYYRYVSDSDSFWFIDTYSTDYARSLGLDSSGANESMAELMALTVLPQRKDGNLYPNYCPVGHNWIKDNIFNNYNF
ncbi:MAG: hypothetical protein KBD51_02910 [Candidatus Levybacteria bacterium]|nr:hypothetical protein [Candidatus Levybacteria bacterium]